MAKAASALLSLALVGGLMVGTAAPAWAEPGTSGGTYTPYSGQTRWDDPATGFTYFDVAGNDPRNLSDSDAFLRQVLTAYTPTNTNLSEKWRYLGLLAAVSNNTFFGDAYSLDDANQTKHYGISTDRGFIRGFLDEVFADGQIPVHEGGGLNQAVSVRAAAQQILDDTGL
ncbi:MAG: hypothetical protein LBU38_07210, partial [Propionibacteriaceae bacterium]|nr:hypothetical protein [Propionibacteriaceae bacterium]